MKLKDRIKHSRALYKQPETKLVPTDLNLMTRIPPGMTRAWANNRFVVMIFDDAPTSQGPAIRVMVQAANALPIPNHWKTMQGIKNEVFGPETVAVEYYPAQSELLDTHNIYWMWIYPKGVLPIPIL
jgi:hypothetical protein